ncbi:MAG: NAD(P)/FAD-dependent oxidoreductase [Methylococcales bacterium]|nr:NAD(P)/FAD-dependent oxidoreductase [Methylococcales bacterium]
MAACSRRRFLQFAAASPAALLSGCSLFPGKSCSKAHVVVVGGGFGGATAAKYLRLLAPELRVTLIEPKTSYITCPGSNWLFADLTDIRQLTVNYRALSSGYDIKLITDSVSRIDPAGRRLTLAGGQTLGYDRLVLSPGIDFHWNTLPGYDAATAEIYPHAWQAGPQTLLLQRQIQAMPDGGMVLISAPAEPYRCPPGPYERASMIACWLQQHKPRSKVMILDAKTGFSKQKLFEAGWAKYFGYGGGDSMLEWHSIADNPLIELDTATGTLYTDFGDKFQGQVLNIIPPQQAGRIARESGLTDTDGWCPVNAMDSSSRFEKHIHVIGDAARYAPIPKSAFAANSEAKACALAVVSLLKQQAPPDPQWLNACYSLITPEHGISVAGVYGLNAEQRVETVKGAGGLSRGNDEREERLEAGYALGVYRSLVVDSFGSAYST